MDITDYQKIKFYDLKDPFDEAGFQSLSIFITRSCANASISFMNGNTMGCHQVNASNIDELNDKLADFFAAMKEKG